MRRSDAAPWKRGRSDPPGTNCHFLTTQILTLARFGRNRIAKIADFDSLSRIDFQRYETGSLPLALALALGALLRAWLYFAIVIRMLKYTVVRSGRPRDQMPEQGLFFSPMRRIALRDFGCASVLVPRE